MGMSALRRYHTPLADSGAVDAAPEVEPGTIDSPEEKVDAAEANAAVTAAEQAEQAEAANADEDGAQSVNPVIQAVGGEEDNPEHGEATIPTTSIPSAAPGDVDVATDAAVEPTDAEARNLDPESPEGRAARAAAAGLTRGSSTAKWQEFAGDTTRSRDELAELYLGPKGS